MVAILHIYILGFVITFVSVSLATYKKSKHMRDTYGDSLWEQARWVGILSAVWFLLVLSMVGEAATKMIVKLKSLIHGG